MKILLLGDASNYHATLATALKAKGHDVTLASDRGKWLLTSCDIDLSRKSGRLSGALLYGRLLTTLAPKLKGYDVVQFVSPGFVSLKPGRLEELLRKLRRGNGSLYLTVLGYDTSVVTNLAGPKPAVAYSEWQIDGKAQPWRYTGEADYDMWTAPRLHEYNEVFYNTIDGALTALYEYHVITQAEHPGLRLGYAGIPVDMSSLPAPSLRPGIDGKIRMLYTCRRGRELEKGGNELYAMLTRISAEFPDTTELVAPENMPFSEFVRTLASADIVSDQMYSYTPGTTALMAMAMGAVPLSGGESEYYRFIGEPYDAVRPIFNPDPRDLEGTYRRLRSLVMHPAELRRMSAAAPGFVARHNEASVVADRFISFWENKEV